MLTKLSNLLHRRPVSGGRQNRRVVFVLGGPGAGKTTLCGELAKRYGLAHLSAGQLLRDEADRGRGPLADEIRRHLDAGTLVPATVSSGLITGAIEALGSDVRVVVLDGFPRDLASLERWEKEASGCCLEVVVVLECSVEERMARLRRGGRGRNDDDPDTAKRRMRVYEEETRPLLDWLESRGCVRSVDAEMPKEKVFNSVVQILEEVLGKDVIQE